MPDYQASELHHQLSCLSSLQTGDHGISQPPQSHEPIPHNKSLYIYRASLVAQMVKKKNLPAIQETQVGSLVREDSLETGIGTHSSILA